MLRARLLHRSITSRRAPVASAAELPGVESRFTQLPARPFAVVLSATGEKAFVSLPREGETGLAVLGAGDRWQVEQVVAVADGNVPRGLALDRSGRHLLVANGAGGLLVLDADGLAAGSGDAVVASVQSPGAGSMQVVVDRQDRFAYVTDEDSASLSVFDFEGTLGSNAPRAAFVGTVPLPPGPVGVTLTADGAHLLVTSQHHSGRGRGGVVSVVDTAEATEDPGRATVRSVGAGLNPVRIRISPSSDVAWVTARGSNALLAFDVPRLIAVDKRALRAVVRVGAAPVGLALLHGGSVVVVANSNRYDADPSRPQSLAVVDADAALSGRNGLVGSVSVGAFPREIAAAPDDRTVLVTNVISQTIAAVTLLA